MSKNLFRKSALDKISYPEQLGEYVKITNPGAWVIVVGCIAILTAVVIWLVVGTIPDTISARGILFPASGTINVTIPASGKINDMRVEAGYDVGIHDIIAVVPQYDILSEIEELKNAAQPDEDLIAKKAQEYIDQSVIRSPLYGTVIWAKHLNEIVSADETVATIAVMEEGTNTYSVIVYMDINTAKRLQSGMEAQISPSFSSREESGYMYGHITSVGKYPVSEDDIQSAIGNIQYMGEVPVGESLVEVKVDIALDANMDECNNAAKWSNPIGNELELTIGMQCDLLIVIKEQKPYELVF